MSSGRDDDAQPIELRPRRSLLGRFSSWVEHANALRGWVEQARKRSHALDATLETIERDSDIGGGMLAGALSYRLFVFALPLAFFVVSGVGLLAGALGIEPHVMSNSVGLGGIVTRQVADGSKEASNWWVALTSFCVLVYATRVLLRAVAIIHSLAWTHTAASVKVSPRSLGVFGASCVGQVLLVAGVGAVGHQTVVGGIVSLVISVFAIAGLWLVISLEVPHPDAGWTDLIPGSFFYAIGFIGVQLFNVLMLGNLIQSKTTTYGALGTAATLLLAFFLLGRVMVGAAVLNATLHDRRSRSRGQQQSHHPPVHA
jgi:uncharacterized BrkB/YihY/UPF0761 family membrane protein